MPLPNVQGWMIDYGTAHAIFASKSNVRISHCGSQCHLGLMYICHYEEQYFRDDDLLADVFLNNQCCVLEPDDDVYERCPAIAANPNGKAILAGDQSAIFITASALARHLGVISNRKSPVFSTVHDLCACFGVPVLTADDYFSLL